ncbi:MAG: GWxTD domain-containing protein [Bacteroidetes bacterium]|nr:GWxTD domain-containing protein [Bacteroidota bacterium]
MSRSVIFIVLIGVNLSILLNGCFTSSKLSNQNISSMYKKESVDVQPDYIVYHNSKMESILYFKINSKELLYTKQPNGYFGCKVHLNYKIKTGIDSKEILDSATTIISDYMENDQLTGKDMYGKIEMKAPIGNSYILEITLTDINRNQDFVTYLQLDKYSIHSNQNFLVCANNTKIPSFKNHFPYNEKVNITYSQAIGSKLYVRYYKKDFPIASPPFSVAAIKSFDYKCDSTFTLDLSDSLTTTVTIPAKGFLHITADTLQKQGLTLYSFYNYFPEVSAPEQLVYPLIYITSQQEYNALLSAPNKKQAVEEFWVKIGGSKERARDLIKKYYGRVIESNKHFTSYLEGWKTDRGMIYIIYGAPNYVYRTANSESWTYGEENNLMSLNYTFIKVINPFTNNDYSIDRSSIYKDRWYRAVDIWRQGRIYLDN